MRKSRLDSGSGKGGAIAGEKFLRFSKRIFMERMTSDRQLMASREMGGHHCSMYGLSGESDDLVFGDIERYS